LHFLQTRRFGLQDADHIQFDANTADRAAGRRLACARSRMLEHMAFYRVDKPAMARPSDMPSARQPPWALDAEQIQKGSGQFWIRAIWAGGCGRGAKAVAKIPPLNRPMPWAGSCLSLVKRRLASGWGANWLSVGQP